VYCTDYHIFRVFLWCLRAQKNTRILQALSPWARQFSNKDWLILSWVCFFHDLGKGHTNRAGKVLDHALTGAKWAKRFLSKVLPASQASVIQEVTFLVRHHLLLSKLSFKKVSSDEDLIKVQKRFRISSDRARRLAVFTALDILGTREEAWNTWKAQLLFQVAEKLQDQELGKRAHLGKFLGFESLFDPKAAESLADAEAAPYFDELVKSVGANLIERDLRDIIRGKSSQSYKVYPFEPGLWWVRFHNRKNQPGVLLEALKAMKLNGLSVQQSYVFSSSVVGVYDWFLVSQKKLKAKMLEQRLESLRAPVPDQGLLVRGVGAMPPPPWRSGELNPMGSESSLFQLVLRGEDRSGLLVSTCEIFLQLGIEVVTARIQTWGKLAEDIFVLKAKLGNPQKWWQKNKHYLIASIGSR
jgi:[protein-PII] uridylyltransferase